MTTLIEEMATQFATAQRAAHLPLSPAELTAIAVSVVRGLGASLVRIDPKLYGELLELVRAIRSARDEIAALRPEEIAGSQLARANDELDAIVAATEQATNQIMSAAEAIEALAGELPAEHGARLTDAVTNIYETCGFQDITGQRVGKVIKVLLFIEERVQRIVEAVGTLGSAETGASCHAGPGGEDALLNGPQLAGAGRTQAEIDALLNSRG